MKKLFAPEETQELLRGWQIHANKGRDNHELAARSLEHRYRQIGVASIVLSAVVGASLFATLELELGSWVNIIGGITSIFAFVLMT